MADAALVFAVTQSTRARRLAVFGFGLSRASDARSAQFVRALSAPGCTVRDLVLSDPSPYLMMHLEAEPPPRVRSFILRLEPEPEVWRRPAGHAELERLRRDATTRNTALVVSAAHWARASPALESLEIDARFVRIDRLVVRDVDAVVGAEAVRALAAVVRSSRSLSTFIITDVRAAPSAAAEEAELVAALGASHSLTKIYLRGSCDGVPYAEREAVVARAAAALHPNAVLALSAGAVPRLGAGTPAQALLNNDGDHSIAHRALMFLRRGAPGDDGA